MPEQIDLENLVVDTALEIADRRSWSEVTFAEISQQTRASVIDIYACYPVLDDIADAWVKRADNAMVVAAAEAVEKNLPMQDRLHHAIMSWIDALQGRRSTMKQVLFYKLEPPHLHLQAKLIVATSNRIQMLREAVHMNATGLIKSVEEFALTALFSSTVLVWLGDSSENFERTRRYLKNQLEFGNILMSKIQ